MPENATSGQTATTSGAAVSTAQTTARPTVQTTATESRVRLTAFFVLVLLIMYLFTGAGVIPIFLLIDFGLRSFGLSAYSPLGQFSGRIAKSLNLSTNPVYMPPKRFSARIGFAFCLAITILHYTAISDAILSLVLGAFAALESLVGFCAGCYVYNAGPVCVIAKPACVI